VGGGSMKTTAASASTTHVPATATGLFIGGAGEDPGGVLQSAQLRNASERVRYREALFQSYRNFAASASSLRASMTRSMKAFVARSVVIPVGVQ